MAPIMDISLLRYFYAVATEGNFTKAAAKLHIGQPVVSQMVKKLEASINVTLFERQKRQVLLTQSGIELLNSCHTIFGELQRAEERLNLSHQEGRIRVGTTEALSNRLLSTISVNFLETFPSAELLCISSPTQYLIEALIKNQIDMAVIDFRFKETPLLESLIIATTNHHIVVSGKRNIKSDSKLTFLSVQGAENERIGKQPSFERLKKAYPSIQRKILTNNLSVQKELVMAGKGIAILPEYLIYNELKSGRIVKLFPKESVTTALYCIKRKSFSPGKAEMWLISEIKNLLK